MRPRARTARAQLRRRGRLTRGMARRRREFPEATSWILLDITGAWGADWAGGQWKMGRLW